ncbi:MAG: TetR family transcriptional regulator [Pseudonocardiaceae bacterium]|nr:TetR family transcriptional regulator [Pseudonocardiaceae bacterium]
MRRHTVARRGPGSAGSAGTAAVAEPARPVKATRKGRETDAAFRQGARTVFARDGYLNAKISDIAGAAGKSVASFYNYYDSKADLLVALAEDFHAETTRLAQLPYSEGRTPREALREAVAGFWHTYADRRGELIGIFQAAMFDPEFAGRWLDIRARAIRNIAAEIRHAQREGYCPGIDPDLTASSLSAMIEQFCYVWQAQGGDRIAGEFTADKAIDTLSSVWFHALYWKPAQDWRP